MIVGERTIQYIYPAVEHKPGGETPDKTAFYGRAFGFLVVPLQLGVEINLRGSYRPSTVDVSIQEDGQNKRGILMVDVSRPDFARTWLSTNTDQVGAYPIPKLPDPTDQYLPGYAAESASKLHFYDTGEKYKFILGQNPECVFIDGWAAHFPLWRITLPIDTQSSEKKVLIPQAQLLVFG